MRLLLLLFIVVLYSLGVGCLVFPRTVQSVAVRAVAMGVTARAGGLRHFVESKEYLTTVRAVGVIALLTAAFLTFVALKRSG